MTRWLGLDHGTKRIGLAVGDPTDPIATRELKSVWERVERLARERLPSLGEDDLTWKPLAITPGAITVDGLQVTDPVALKGRELSLSAFGVADKTYTTLEKINSKTNDVLRAVDRAWDECDDAQDYETLDMFASNAFATVISHAETEEAAEYLADAVEAIKDYSEYMEKVKGEPYMVEANIDIDDIRRSLISVTGSG